ncbi:MAG: ABC transporter permease [Chloroflexota bacterium]
MTSLAPVARPSAWAEPGPLRRFVEDTLAVADVEVRKVRHDPSELVTRAVQPVLWLLIFGQVLATRGGIDTGDVAYLAYLTPGVLAQSALFTSIFYGITIIMERDLGVVARYLVSPAPRSSLVLGRALAAGVRALSQAVAVIALALVLGVHLELDVPRLVAIAGVVVLGSAVFTLFSLTIAFMVKTRERVMGMGQLLTMPLFFASNAIYPISSMPGWLQVIAAFNPLTYMVGALRSLMIAPEVDLLALAADVGVLAACLALFTLTTVRLFPRIVV